MLLSALGFPVETVLVFIALLVGAMAIDCCFHRHQTVVSIKSAAVWSLFWLLMSLVFGGYLYWQYGSQTASLFFTAYALEQVLSLDNLFVMIAIFAWFHIPEHLRRRVLYWGLLGALLFRLIFVGLGVGLLSISPYMQFLFAAAVAKSAYLMMKDETAQENDDADDAEDYTQHTAYRRVHQWFAVFPKLHGHYFFLRGKTLAEARAAHPDVKLELAGENVKRTKLSRPRRLGKNAWVATPLFLCLAVIEVSDLMFAFDSVPAVIAVAREPLIVYSAMIFAILTLRNVYFVLDSLRSYLLYLESAVVISLYFIAFKLLLSASNHWLHHGWQISPNAALVVIVSVLTAGVAASLLFPQED